MVHQGPSIQSYFNPKPSPQKRIRPRVNDPTSDGFAEEHHGDPLVLVDSSLKDGFTEEEIESALHPKLHVWQPRAEYRDVDIGSLTPGPGCIAMMGRVVNFYDMATPSKKPQAAKGCLKVVIKDDTGCLVVSDRGLCRILCCSTSGNLCEYSACLLHVPSQRTVTIR